MKRMRLVFVVVVLAIVAIGGIVCYLYQDDIAGLFGDPPPPPKPKPHPGKKVGAPKPPSPKPPGAAAPNAAVPPPPAGVPVPAITPPPAGGGAPPPPPPAAGAVAPPPPVAAPVAPVADGVPAIALPGAAIETPHPAALPPVSKASAATAPTTSFAAMLPEGMRAMTIVTDTMVAKDDHVDVIYTQISEHSGTSSMLAVNVPVLAVISHEGMFGVTLQVSDEQAQKLTLGQKLGSMTLAVRSAKDDDSKVPPPVRADQLQGGQHHAEVSSPDDDGSDVKITRGKSKKTAKKEKAPTPPPPAPAPPEMTVDTKTEGMSKVITIHEH